MYYRNDGSEEDWDSLSAVLFLAKHKLRDRWFNDRLEVIFNVENETAKQPLIINQVTNGKLDIYPNPASANIFYQSK